MYIYIIFLSRRMVPHIFGWFTMSAAWIIMIVMLSTRTRPSTKPYQRTQCIAYRCILSGPSTTWRRSQTASSRIG